MTIRLLLIVAFAILLVGCAPSLVDARAAVNRITETYAATEPALEKQRRDAGDACFTAYPPGDAKVQPCLDGVNARWRPVELAVAAMYVALASAQQSVGIAEAAERIGQRPSVTSVMAVVVRLIDAAAKLEAVVEMMHRAPVTPGPAQP